MDMSPMSDLGCYHDGYWYLAAVVLAVGAVLVHTRRVETGRSSSVRNLGFSSAILICFFSGAYLLWLGW